MSVRQESDVCGAERGGSKAWALPDAPCCTRDFCKAEVIEKSLRGGRGGRRERGMVLDTRITCYGFMLVHTRVGAEGRWNRFASVKKNHCNFEIPTICGKMQSKSPSPSLSPLSACSLLSPGPLTGLGLRVFVLFLFPCLIWGQTRLSQFLLRQHEKLLGNTSVFVTVPHL